MSSESEATEMQSVLERLITLRSRDLSLFIPFLLGFTAADPGPTRNEPEEPDSNSGDPDQDSTPDHHQRDRIILINPLTQGMVVIEGTTLDSLFHNSPEKQGPPPASKSSIEAMPSVETREGDEGECVICLDEWLVGGIVKEMPCRHRFHGDCIEKWLGMHGSCPVCRHTMPAEEEGGKKQGEERENQGRERSREIWVSFSIGSRRRRTEENSAARGGDANRLDSVDSGDQSDSAGDSSESQTEEREPETGN